MDIKKIFLESSGNKTIRLREMISSLDDIEEGEILLNYIDEDDLDKEYIVNTIPWKQLYTIKTIRGDMEVIEAYENYASDWQKELVESYVDMIKSGKLPYPENVVIMNKGRLLDGHHRLVAHYLAEKDLEYIDISKSRGLKEEEYEDDDIEEVDDIKDDKYKIKKSKSNNGKFVFRNGKMLFNRVGPISGQVQTGSNAPERKGMWAFPFPIFDHFFVSGSFSFPSQMAPKNPNNKKLNTAEKEELQKMLNIKLDKAKKIKSSVPNFKEISKTHPELSNEYHSLMYIINNIERMIKSQEPVSMYKYYSLLDKGDEYDKIEKPLPKAELTPDERKKLEREKSNIEKAMAALKPKLRNDGEPYHDIDHKYTELEYKLSDVNELLNDEGTKQLQHSKLVGPKHTKIKKFWYGGPIYARFDNNGEIIGSGGSGNWYKFNTIKEYLDVLRKVIIDYSDSHKEGWGDRNKNPEFVKRGVRGLGIQSNGAISSDHLEVFIPM